METSVLPISDYGLIGDGRTAALVGTNGGIEWLCLPHFDSEPCFAALLDRNRGGFFTIEPTDRYTSRQYYLENSNVLTTEFETDTGRARILDAFAATSEAKKKATLWPEQEIVRAIECLAGEMELKMTASPRFEFAVKTVKAEKLGQTGFGWRTGAHLLFFQSSLSLESISAAESDLSATFSVKCGERETFSLSFSSTGPATLPAMGEFLDERLNLTNSYWRDWADRCKYQGPYTEQVRCSALALKLLLFSPSGAIVAAPTTSLPEKLRGERNWDYRYCWLRDASFTVRALTHLGYIEEAEAFVGWMLHSTRLTHPRLKVLYSVFGQARISETEIGNLAGYRDSTPVRLGNGASDQVQLDVYGEVLDAIYCFLPHMRHIDSETRNFIIGLGDAVCELWPEPDDGIWEVRSGRQHHTHSKVLAWVAPDRLIKICKHHSWQAPFNRFESAMIEIRAAIETDGYNYELGSYTRTFNGDELDGSLLTLPLLGYCEAGSSRMKSTIAAVRHAMSQGDLVYRYRGVNDGLQSDEGAFGICSFWLIECLAKAGKPKEALRLFESFMSRANAVGLWSEEIDPHSGEFLGNYPQGFTHIGLINCALTLFNGGTQ